MTRTTITYLDANGRTRRLSVTDGANGDDSGWYVDLAVVALRRETRGGGNVTTMIPLSRVLRIETTESLNATQRRLLWGLVPRP